MKHVVPPASKLLYVEFRSVVMLPKKSCMCIDRMCGATIGSTCARCENGQTEIHPAESLTAARARVAEGGARAAMLAMARTTPLTPRRRTCIGWQTPREAPIVVRSPPRRGDGGQLLTLFLRFTGAPGQVERVSAAGR